MLVILYGTLAEMGKVSRDHFIQRGFHPVKKLYCAADPQLTPMFSQREYITEAAFLEQTDSLFRYEVGGIQVGCDQQQIADAVYGNGKYFLTLAVSSENFAMLERIKQQQEQIKNVYENNVCLIYTYVDNAALRYLVRDYPVEERHLRLQIGREIRENYLKHQHIFDHVVIYGGKRSAFGLKELCDQYDHILSVRAPEKKEDVRYGDVFIACPPQEADVEWRLYGYLRENGVSVFDNGQFRTDRQTDLSHDKMDKAVAAEAIRRAKIVVPVLSRTTEKYWRDEMTQLLAAADNGGCAVFPLLADGAREEMERAFGEPLYRAIAWFSLRDDVLAEKTLTHEIARLFKNEKEMKRCAAQAEEYRRLHLWEQAHQWQKDHWELCRQAILSNAIGFHYFGGVDAVSESATKLARIMLHMDDTAQTAIAFLSEQADPFEDVMVEELLRCYAHCRADGDTVYHALGKRLYPHLSPDQWLEGEAAVVLESWMAEYADLLAQAEAAVKTSGGGVPVSQDEVDIADNGEKAIELFETVLKAGGDEYSRHDLIEGYQRVRDYCTRLPSSNEVAQVAQRCLEHIGNLQADDQTDEAPVGEKTTALKAYLGKPLPYSGEFDVFLSFKSEDVALARTLYEFLTRNGKVVFFSEITLHQMGDSTFENSIDHAIRHAKHMVVVASDPNYLKTKWVHHEWSTYQEEEKKNGKRGNLLMVLTDNAVAHHKDLPIEMQNYEFVRMRQYRELLLYYLR